MLRCTLVLAVVTSQLAAVAAISVCRGEGPRYGDYKCNHDATHRVCATLKSPDSSKVLWGSQDFWHLTSQPDWSSHVGSDPRNPGGGWCICMWATARLIRQVGCDSVHLDCASTDVDYVLQSYRDGGEDLAPAKECLRQKCPTAAESNATQLAPAWDGKTVQDLHNEYPHIFKSGNRNAAAFLWSSFLLDNARGLSHSTLVQLAMGYCPVSGSPVTPSAAYRYHYAALPMVGGGSIDGYLLHCCWPCACDATDLVRVDTKTIATSEGSKQYLVAVMGDPCQNEVALSALFVSPFNSQSTSLAAEAPEVQCKAGKLQGATLSDGGFVILSLVFTATGSTGAAAATAVVQPSDGATERSSMTEKCEARADTGYASGMGVIFRKVAEITVIENTAEEMEQRAIGARQNRTQAIASNNNDESMLYVLYIAAAAAVLGAVVAAVAVSQRRGSSSKAGEKDPSNWVNLDHENA